MGDKAQQQIIHSESRIQKGPGLFGERKFVENEQDSCLLPGGASALMEIDNSDNSSGGSGTAPDNSASYVDPSSACSPPVNSDNLSPFVIRSPTMRRGMSAQQALQRSIKKTTKHKSDDCVSPFGYNEHSPSPSPDSNYELEEDLRTFEEKYKIIDESNILGEGCSSVVKICVLRAPRPAKDGNGDKEKSGSPRRRVYKKHESSPLLCYRNMLDKDSPKQSSAEKMKKPERDEKKQSPSKMFG